MGLHSSTVVVLALGEGTVQDIVAVAGTSSSVAVAVVQSSAIAAVATD